MLPGALGILRYRDRRSAGVAQWQSSSLPSWLCGFDPRRPLPANALLRGDYSLQPIIPFTASCALRARRILARTALARRSGEQATRRVDRPASPLR